MRIFNLIQGGRRHKREGGGCEWKADIGCRTNSERQLTNY